MKYAIAATAWGPVLFATRGGGLCRLLLPLRRSADAHGVARRQWAGAEYSAELLPKLQTQLHKYFDGGHLDFRMTIDLGGGSAFRREVLLACRTIPFGETVTYGQLADLAGHPGAARAVGSVMAGNPIPLLIPCHRVVAANGRLGGFSAPGGSRTKTRLLQLEARRATGGSSASVVGGTSGTGRQAASGTPSFRSNGVLGTAVGIESEPQDR